MIRSSGASCWENRSSWWTDRRRRCDEEIRLSSFLERKSFPLFVNVVRQSYGTYDPTFSFYRSGRRGIHAEKSKSNSPAIFRLKPGISTGNCDRGPASFALCLAGDTVDGCIYPSVPCGKKTFTRTLYSTEAYLLFVYFFSKVVANTGLLNNHPKASHRLSMLLAASRNTYVSTRSLP